MSLVVLSAAGYARAQGPFNGVGLPGTPDVGFVNPGGAVLATAQDGTSFIPQPITNPANVAQPAPYFAFAGDIIFLLDPNGGTARSNWGAILQFFNPSDPSGALNLEATLLESIGPPNTLGDFSTFALLPNVAYASNPQCDSSACSGVVSEFGPTGAISAGQFFVYSVSASRPSAAVPEPQSCSLLIIGAGVLLVTASRRLRLG